MIDQAALTNDLKKLLEKDLLPALKTRTEAVTQIDTALRAEHQAAKDAGRTSQAFEIWRQDHLTQVGVAWLLGCVFVRFMEDNGLVDGSDQFPRIAGSPRGNPSPLQQARDQHTAFVTRNPTKTDRDYLLWVFEDVATLRGCHELFSKAHNPLWAQSGSLMDADAASRLLAFFQELSNAGDALKHDFADPDLGTRFLGDLYQNLSEAARKKYALLQTPVFVEEFILDRTLEPAIKEFGLCDQKGRELSAQKKPIPSDHLLRLIDPTVGSGHFLLGAFRRLFAHWQRQEPMTEPAVLAERCLNSLFGVDLNPYAANIARFRLLVAALKACGTRRLREARDWTINIAVGDSLLHGSFAGGSTGGELFEAQVRTDTGNQYVTSAEDLETLRRFLMPHRYHVVVGNPPYITVKDAALSEAYRRRYGSCHRQYALTVPFFERFFDLAVAPEGAEVSKAGFVGKITGNAFMKREFGKKLIETNLPRWDLTHVIDTQLAHIPEHGTATAIIFGRHRPPIAETVRMVSGLRREAHEPDPPESGKVWQAILVQVGRPGTQSEFVSVADVSRKSFHSHPWSIGGGGAAELKDLLHHTRATTLGLLLDDYGARLLTRLDDVFELPTNTPARAGIPSFEIRRYGLGQDVRDWSLSPHQEILFPYDSRLNAVGSRFLLGFLWPWRALLIGRIAFGKSQEQHGLAWFEYSMFFRGRIKSNPAVVFSDVATHNHFVLDRASTPTNSHAPVINLPAGASEDDHLALVGLLNSASACFWMKQVFYDKGGGGISEGVKAEHWERFFEHDGTKLKQLPVPWEAEGTENSLRVAVMAVARDIDTLAQARANLLPDAILGADGSTDFTRAQLDEARKQADLMLQRMIALQEELDWLVYRAYGLLEDTEAENAPAADAPPINLGERAFEIVMARKMEAGTLQTEWFRRHGSTPITKTPAHWPEAYRKVVEHRIALIEAGPKQNKDIALIEQPEYKRRWNTEKWEEMEERALREWLLDRLEWGDKEPSAGSPPGESRSGMWDERDPRLMTAARLADRVRGDAAFMHSAGLYRGRADFDLTELVVELVQAESVPFLPVLRYKESGLTMRAIWERVWELQREEDRLEALREAARARMATAREAVIGTSLKAEHETLEQARAEAARLRQQVCAAHFPDQPPEGVKIPKSLYQRLLSEGNAKGAGLVHQMEDAEKRVTTLGAEFEEKVRPLLRKDAAWTSAETELEAVPPNPEVEVPPRYASKDFLPGPYWRLRGKLDVPKERFVSYPHCGPDGDPSPLIGWAGFDHRQQARAITMYYTDKKANAAWEKGRFIPLLAGLLELLPWLKQWHNEHHEDGHNWAEVFEAFIDDEARELSTTVEAIREWQAPAPARRGRRRARAPETDEATPLLAEGND